MERKPRSESDDRDNNQEHIEFEVELSPEDLDEHPGSLDQEDPIEET